MICNLFYVARATIEVPPRDTTVNVTNDATFTCTVAGIPLPSITWTLPDGSIRQALDEQTEERIFADISISEETPYQATSILYITSASPADVGEYTCTPANVHESVSSSASLTVQGWFKTSCIKLALSMCIFHSKLSSCIHMTLLKYEHYLLLLQFHR